NTALLPCTPRSNTVPAKTNQSWAPPECSYSRPTPYRHRRFQLAHLSHLQPVRHFRLITKPQPQQRNCPSPICPWLQNPQTQTLPKTEHPSPPPPFPMHNLQPFGRSRSALRQNSTSHDLPRLLNNGIDQAFPLTREASGSNAPPLPTSTAPATPPAPPQITQPIISQTDIQEIVRKALDQILPSLLQQMIAPVLNQALAPLLSTLNDLTT
ncbi:hypothetical protein IscW_ISCW014742, partial [Ixodes scapularis]